MNSHLIVMSKVQKVMTQPVNVIFSMLRSVRGAGRGVGRRRAPPAKAALGCWGLTHIASPALYPTLLRPQKQRVSVWLYEQPHLRLEGRIAVSPDGGTNSNPGTRAPI